MTRILALLFAMFATTPALAYDVARTELAPAVLLEGSDAHWSTAHPINWGPAAHATTFRAQWSGAGLHLRFDATDPDPWWTLAERDAWLWQEEVVEIFLDLDGSGRDYAEIEVSPGNVVCDVRMVAPLPHKQSDYSWNLEGIESRVQILRDDAGQIGGWQVRLFLPWDGFRSLPAAQRVALPPSAGARFRFNVFRVERPHGKAAPDRDVIEAAWSPTGGPGFHVPAAFRDFVLLE
jgi:hypothetical protein